MTRFDHSVNASDGRRYVKVVFPVEREPGVSSESMWTEVLPDGSYQLKNIPAWVSGLSLDDVVVARARERATLVQGSPPERWALNVSGRLPESRRSTAVAARIRCSAGVGLPPRTS